MIEIHIKFRATNLLPWVAMAIIIPMLLPEPQKYVKMVAFWAIIRGLGLLFYLLWGFR